MRQFVFLSLVMMATPVLPQSVMDKWEVSRSTDELRGTETVTAMYGKLDGYNKRVVYVRCKNDRFEVFVSFDEYLNNDDPVPVAYKFDDGQIVQERWSVSTQGTAAFADKPREFAKNLMGSERLVIEVANYQATTYQESFSLNGSANTVSQVIDSCS